MSENHNFRISLPYGFYDCGNFIIFFNREYSRIGQKSFYIPPEDLLSTVYFYNDGTKPWESKKNALDYLIKIRRIQKCCNISATDYEKNVLSQGLSILQRM